MTEHSINITMPYNEYNRSRLRRTDLTAEPIGLFEQWFKQACNTQPHDANVMNVGTVDANGQSYQRLVLLKYFDHKGIVFYTNLSSRKAIHLTQNPHISLHFSWYTLKRQVLILGRAEQLSVIDVMPYFHSRPYDSQISAWVSHQSSLIATRDILESKFLELKKKFSQGTVPLPSFWGGYRVIIDAMEFWQSGEHRLHDRFLYQRKNGGWHIDRLAP